MCYPEKYDEKYKILETRDAYHLYQQEWKYEIIPAVAKSV